MPIRTFRRFLQTETASGMILFLTAIFALIVDNSSWAGWYTRFFDTVLTVQWGEATISKPLLLWINEGLMVTFFLMIGLEIKREMFEGELRGLSQVILPTVVAVGGMLVPALIYVIFNYENSYALRGWAIATPTDIAFALGILLLLHRRIPISLKIFLTAVAIFDDIGAIIVIAAFYTSEISAVLLAVSAILVICLMLMNRFNVTRMAPY